MTRPVASTDTIFQVLAHEHRDLEARFSAFHEAAADDFEAARQSYPDLAAAVIAHLHAEATVLVPRLAQIPALASILDGMRADQARIETEALALAHATLTPSEWVRGVRRLERDLERLIEREEAQVYPLARRALPPEESHDLARELRTVEDQERDDPST